MPQHMGGSAVHWNKPVLLLLLGLLLIGLLFYHSFNDASVEPSGRGRPSTQGLTQKNDPQHAKKRPVKAAIVALARNQDRESLMKVIRNVEERFNRQHGGYDWVFLNDNEFDDAFKADTQAMMVLSGAKAHYGVVPKEHWSYPDFIDQNAAAEVRKNMSNIIYGWSESYRHMCRFNSGFLWQHPLMAQYDYYWRVEPGNVEYFCDMDDPFATMERNGFKYGWTVMMYEYMETIPGLWKAVKDFMKKHPEHIHPNNAMELITDNNGETYNGCHFWTNFEIVDLGFYRSKAYVDFFNHLDRAGGFFYERWGDAPVHSIAAALLLDKSELHYFDDIGYRHDLFQHCPMKNNPGRCLCKKEDDWNWNNQQGCGKKWNAMREKMKKHD